MRYIIKDLASGRELCARLGIKGADKMSLHQMQRAVNEASKTVAKAVKRPAVAKTALTTIGALKEAARLERDASLKMDKYQELANALQSELTKLGRSGTQADAVKAAELHREFADASKRYAYASLALRTSDIKAWKAKQLINRASE